MNRIKFVLFLSIVLLFSACSFIFEVPETHVGTISMVKKKEVTGFLMGYINQRTYSYKLEITTTDGIVIKGEYEDEPDKYRPGDFVKVSISKNKIDDLKILDRALMDSHY